MSYALPYQAGSLDGFMLRNIIRITFSCVRMKPFPSWIAKGMKSANDVKKKGQSKGKNSSEWRRRRRRTERSQTNIPTIFRSLRISILIKTMSMETLEANIQTIVNFQIHVCAADLFLFYLFYEKKATGKKL